MDESIESQRKALRTKLENAEAMASFLLSRNSPAWFGYTQEDRDNLWRFNQEYKVYKAPSELDYEETDLPF